MFRTNLELECTCILTFIWSKKLMLKIPIPLAIWKPFSSIFRVFDTLFAYRAFRVHPWFGYPFFAFFSSSLEHLVRPPMEVLIPPGDDVTGHPPCTLNIGGMGGGGGWEGGIFPPPPIPRDRHPLNHFLFFPSRLGGGGGGNVPPVPPPPRSYATGSKRNWNNLPV